MEYHVNNLLSPVLFYEALLHVPKDAILVEIAPHCLLQLCDEVTEVNLESNQKDAYLAGHQLDGNVLFSMAGCMVLVWKALSKRCGKPYQKVPVVFEDVTHHRTIVLPKTGAVRIVVNVMPASGEFEVSEAGTLVASGRVRMAEEGEKLADKDPPSQSTEAVAYELDAGDIYKEFRLRGYEYSGSFQSILKADLQEPCGKVKWVDNWVTFIDSIIQFYLFLDLRRTFRMVVKIQSCRIDPKVHDKLACNTGDKGLPVIYDRSMDTCRAGGVIIQGIKADIEARRAPPQAPCLEEYRFVPYIDDEQAKKKREARLQEYIDVCSCMVRRILQACGEDMPHFSESIKDHSEVTKEVLDKHLQSRAEKNNLLRVLISIEEEINSCSSSLVQAAQKALSTHKKGLNEDILSTALLEEDPLRDLLEVVVENTSAKRLRILELATEESVLLLTPPVSRLLALVSGLLKIDYAVVHPCPHTLTQQQLPEGVRRLLWKPGFASMEELHDADLVISRIGPSDLNGLEALFAELSAHCKERAFVLLSQRTALAPAEIFLSKMCSAPFTDNAKDIVLYLLGAHGFRMVGHRTNNYSALFLLRKVTAVTETTKRDIIRIYDANFYWLEELKTKTLECENSPKDRRLWLIANSSGVSGIVGLMNCLRMEMGASQIRLLSTLHCKDDATASDHLLGLEFSGRDPEGRRVMGLVPAKAMATVVAADPGWLWNVPDDWSLEEASTVPVAYSTAYYALLVRGNMQPGETVLVHSGSEVAAQAAISIALSMECTVFTTVGVNLVLNFQSEEKLRESVRCLAKHGRFIQISECGRSSDYPTGTSTFLNSVTFHGISLQTLHDGDPLSMEEKSRVRELVREGIASGAVRPLDTCQYRWDQAEEAFRFMATGKHTRKIVLEIRKEESPRKKCLPSPVTFKVAARAHFYSHKCYVIVGGLGGMGLELADWMVGRGCRKLLLTSRSGVRSGYQRLCHRRWQYAGAEVTVSKSDASIEEGARKVIEEASAMGPVGGIFNLAMRSIHLIPNTST
ncbi:hypothetical protein V5799_006228 [Amblyomma americanum]|uniref:PKS/mFAS DH domain-containing protein n=1 Tax=Amblyomma americanum TaxID=6943 RepID=A0AAQ4DWZ9_AMBAM